MTFFFFFFEGFCLNLKNKIKAIFLKFFLKKKNKKKKKKKKNI